VANQLSIQINADFETRYPDASPKATECAMNLVFTADLLVKRIADLLHPFELTPASGLVLSMLADSDTPLAPNVIADQLIISRATVTGLIDSLERREYVQRTPNPADRRSILVAITESGRETAKSFRPIVHQHQRVWFEILSETEQQRLIDSLHCLQTVLLESD
jgi:DNA-binding MarR family transcriptional regulator